MKPILLKLIILILYLVSWMVLPKISELSTSFGGLLTLGVFSYCGIIVFAQMVNAFFQLGCWLSKQLVIDGHQNETPAASMEVEA